MTGTVKLKSGNQIRWTQIEVSDRGAIRVEFLHDPSDVDIEDAKEISRSLMPEDGKEAFCDISDGGSSDVKLNDFLTHGARNN